MHVRGIFAGTVLLLQASCGGALAQVPSQLCFVAAGQPSTSCYPVATNNPLPVQSSGTGPSTAAGAQSVVSASQYPVNAATPVPTPLAQASNGTTGSVVASLTAGAGATTYICGFNVSAVGGTAAVGPVQISGVLGGTQSYEMNAAATPVLLSQSFSPCLPASTVNTAITATTVADGTATAVHVNVWGYRL